MSIKKKKIAKVCLLTSFGLLGLIMAVYPAVSNWLYEIRQDGVVATYQAAIDDDTDNAAQGTALLAARQYNDQLCTLSAGTGIDAQYYAAQDIESINDALSGLNVAGTGVIAYVDVPAIDTYLPIYFGTTDDSLTTGVGVLEYSSLPVGGTGSHTILCGHSGISTARIFSDLPEMVVGDVFFIHVLGETLAYEVDQIVTVLPEDISQAGIDADMDYCTLLTCTPYGINTHRLLVRGVRIDYEEAMEAAENLPERSVPTNNTWESEYKQALLTGVMILVVILIVWLAIVQLRSRIRAKRDSQGGADRSETKI